MIAVLARRSFVDDPTWQLVEDRIPIGAAYIVLGFERGLVLLNLETKKRRKVDCYLVHRAGDPPTTAGYFPCEMFENETR